MNITYYERFKLSYSVGQQMPMADYITTHIRKSYPSKQNYTNLLKKYGTHTQNAAIKSELHKYKVSSNGIIPTGHFVGVRNIGNFNYNSNVYIDFDIKNIITDYSEACSFTKKMFDIISELKLPYITYMNISYSDAGLSIVVNTNGKNIDRYRAYHNIVTNRLLLDIANAIGIDAVNKLKNSIDYRPVTSLMIATAESYDCIYYNDNSIGIDVLHTDDSEFNIETDNNVNTSSKKNNTVIYEKKHAGYIDLSYAQMNAIFDKAVSKHGEFKSGNRTKTLVYFYSTLNAISVSFAHAIEFLETKYTTSELGSDYVNIGIDIYERYKTQQGTLRYNKRNTVKTTNTDVYKENSVFNTTIDKEYFIDGYISDSPYVSELQNKFKYGGMHILLAPTGVGKTTFVKNLPYKKIVVVPTNMAIEQNQHSGSTYYSKNTTISSNADTIFTNYHSCTSLFKKLGNEIYDYLIVIDEAHNVFAATSIKYLNRVMVNIFQYLDSIQHNRMLFLTATPIFEHITEYKIPIVTKITSVKKHTTKEIKSIETDDFNSFVFSSIKQNITSSANDMSVIYCNNTNKRLVDLLANAKKIGLADSEIVVINSFTKSTAMQKQLIDTNLIPDGTKLIITTSLLKESVNILNPYNVVNTYVLDTIHPVMLEQLASRFRRVANLVIYRPHRDEISDNQLIDIETKRKKLMDFVITENQYHNENYNSQTDPISGDQYLKLHSSKYQIWNFYTKKVEVNYMKINNELFLIDRYNTHNCFGLFKWYMENYGWIVNHVTEAEMSITENVYEPTSTKEYNEYVDTQISEVKTDIQSHIGEDYTNINNIEANNNIANKYLHRIGILMKRGVCKTDAIRLMDDVKNNSQKWNNLIESLDLYSIIKSPDFASKVNNETVNDIKRLFNAIQVGHKYSASELAKITKDALSTFKFSDKKATSFVKRIFKFKQVYSHTVYVHKETGDIVDKPKYGKLDKEMRTHYKRKVHNCYLVVSNDVFSDYNIKFNSDT